MSDLGFEVVLKLAYEAAIESPHGGREKVPACRPRSSQSSMFEEQWAQPSK